MCMLARNVEKIEGVCFLYILDNTKRKKEKEHTEKYVLDIKTPQIRRNKVLLRENGHEWVT